jgi:hypothetical protein
MEDSRTPIVTAPLDLILSNVGDAAITFADTTNIAADKYAKDLSFIEYPFCWSKLSAYRKIINKFDNTLFRIHTAINPISWQTKHRHL